MKILAIQSSPAPDAVSVSRLTMHALADGMEEAGAEVERVDLKRVDLKPCTGCYACFFKTPGACVIPDQMSSELFGKFVSADAVILSSPLYFYTINGQMKTFIDRTHPFLLNPLESYRFDYSALNHELLHGYRGPHPKMIVMVSGQSYVPEVFGPVSAYFRYIYRDHLVGEFYRCESVLMGHHGNFKAKKERLLEALREAGSRFVAEGRVPSDLQAEYNAPFDSMNEALDCTRLVFDTCLSKRFSMVEFIQSNQKWLYPTDAEHFMKLMSLNFNPEAAAGARLSVLFDFGEEAGSCWFRVEGGALACGLGTIDAPGVVVATSLDTWTEVMHGRTDIRAEVMKKTMRLTGDLMAMMKFPQLFAGRQYA